MSACNVVTRIDIILTMPETYARIASQQFGIQIVPLPVAPPVMGAHLYWHVNVEEEPANRWLRRSISSAFGGKFRIRLQVALCRRIKIRIEQGSSSTKEKRAVWLAWCGLRASGGYLQLLHLSNLPEDPTADSNFVPRRM